jgi:hypothetical protein
VTKGPISAGRQCQSSFGSGSGASREEAPEESIFLKRDAVPGFRVLLVGIRDLVSEAGRKSGRPKKGRRTSLDESSGLWKVMGSDA